MDNKIVSDTKYINLIKSINKRFKMESESNYGLIVINQDDYSILFINNSLLRFLNRQWVDLISESVSSILTIEDFSKLMYEQKNNHLSTFNKLLGKKTNFVSCNIELVSNEVRTTLNLNHLRIYIDNVNYDLIYGITCNPLFNNIKCVTNSPIDPWINSFTKLMYTITDDYNRFWMFIFGVIISIFICQATIYINKPEFICNPSNSLDPLLKKLAPK